MQRINIAVIGGGVSGMMAAIHAKTEYTDVTILESGKRVGNKILLTGNGKCNFSNLFLDESCYYSKDITFLKETFHKFSPQDTKDFFESLGMLVKEKNGYLYPLGEQASIVLDILRMELKKRKVSVIAECKVSKMKKEKDTFFVESESGQTFSFDKVILTTGGRSYAKTGSDGSGYKLAKKLGHSVYPTVPALVQLCGKDSFYKIVAGVRSEGSVSCIIDGKMIRRENGEIQFTDYGISGIPVFQISRLVSYGIFEHKEINILVDVLPKLSEKDVEDLVFMRRNIHMEDTLEEFLCGLTNKKLCQLALKLNHLSPEEKVSKIGKKQLFDLINTLKHIEYHIVDTKGYDTAQVTAGGVLLSEINNDFSSKITKNLYFAGEILDVDGICGGYNLQWAFSSGKIAGESAAGE